MKRVFSYLAVVFALVIPMVAMSSCDKPVTFEQLPTQAQQIIKQHFASHKVAIIMMDVEMLKKSYEVSFTNGDKVEFDKKGEWKEIDCPTLYVPAALVPQAIANHVKASYPDASIVELSRDARGYEVKLSNRLELKFDKKFRLMGLDD